MSLLTVSNSTEQRSEDRCPTRPTQSKPVGAEAKKSQAWTDGRVMDGSWMDGLGGFKILQYVLSTRGRCATVNPYARVLSAADKQNGFSHRTVGSTVSPAWQRP